MQQLASNGWRRQRVSLPRACRCLVLGGKEVVTASSSPSLLRKSSSSSPDARLGSSRGRKEPLTPLLTCRRDADNVAPVQLTLQVLEDIANIPLVAAAKKLVRPSPPCCLSHPLAGNLQDGVEERL